MLKELPHNLNKNSIIEIIIIQLKLNKLEYKNAYKPKQNIKYEQISQKKISRRNKNKKQKM
jgi:hypothetical protein